MISEIKHFKLSMHTLSGKFYNILHIKKNDKIHLILVKLKLRREGHICGPRSLRPKCRP